MSEFVVDDRDLEMPRTKPRWLVASFAYRVGAPLAARLVGAETLIRWLVDTELLMQRLAFEYAGKSWGDPFANRVLGMDAGLMRQWIPPGSAVLDVGCGEGRGGRMAIAAGAGEVVGIDRDGATVARARARSPEMTFVQGDVTHELPAQLGRRFYAALLLDVLEHVEEPVGFLRALAEVADWLILEVPDVEASWSNVARRRLRTRFYTDDDHVREYSRASLQDQIVAAGWQLSHIESRHGVLIAVAGDGSI